MKLGSSASFREAAELPDPEPIDRTEMKTEQEIREQLSRLCTEQERCITAVDTTTNLDEVQQIGEVLGGLNVQVDMLRWVLGEWVCTECGAPLPDPTTRLCGHCQMDAVPF